MTAKLEDLTPTQLELLKKLDAMPQGKADLMRGIIAVTVIAEALREGLDFPIFVDAANKTLEMFRASVLMDFIQNGLMPTPGKIVDDVETYLMISFLACSKQQREAAHHLKNLTDAMPKKGK